MPTAPRLGAMAAAVAVALIAHAPARATPRAHIPAHFAGLSVEWSLVERYMGPNARPVFANLLRNLGTGVLRVGGGPQDVLPFARTTANDHRVITPADLAAIRATLDAANAGDPPDATPSWGTILGAGLAPGPPRRDAGSVRRFVRQGVAPAFSGAARRAVAGVELGNEVDVTYTGRMSRYLRDFAAAARASRPYGIVAPSTSAVIAPRQRIRRRTLDTRFFWKWPVLVDAIAPTVRARRSAFGAFATDHFYPAARGCSVTPYRCATIARLLSRDRMANLRFQVATHARAAARAGLRYRLAELNSAANRGVHGVSDVAASALWALEAMFTAADAGAIGVNFHNAEVHTFRRPADGNAYYNPIAYDPTPAMGAPTATPEYYGLLLFARFAQGTRALRRVATGARSVSGWRVEVADGGSRLFLINKSARPVQLTLATPGASSFELDRLSPLDASGGGATLTAPAVRIDGRAVGADGVWPGFQPATGAIAGGRLPLTLGAAEAAVVTLG